MTQTQTLTSHPYTGATECGEYAVFATYAQAVAWVDAHDCGCWAECWR